MLLFRMLFVTAAMVATPVLAMGQTTAAPTPHDYFVAHSFGFPMNFREYHPGPEWILQNANDFKLTSDQTLKLKAITMQMFQDMGTLGKTSKATYAKYKADSSSPTVSPTTLKSDIDAIGKADEALAFTMIPYHMQGYNLLDASQKKTYTMLAKKLQTTK